MPNRLAGSTSPYLLQHVEQPVAWEPWGPEALSRAIREDKPIFLSVGYSSCHWCHVMAHESFEDAGIAALLNAHLVPVKVDREERPDIDAVYMKAVQLLTGRAGWPMSVFLTPALEPFFAGTYWPADPHRGMPGFRQVLGAVIDAWHNRRGEALRQATEITRAIREAAAAPGDGPGDPSVAWLDAAAAALRASHDAVHGGFGSAPKFPHPIALRLLLRTATREASTDGAAGASDARIVVHTLTRMAAGGIHDHLGGGFARYSVDARWLVPHFEKMLSDNALLAVASLEAFLATGESSLAALTRSTLDFILRDMTDPEGGFWSAQDADSDGEEGRYSVWTPEDVEAVLGAEEGRFFCDVYDITPAGNFEGRSIPNLPESIAVRARRLGIDPEAAERRLDNARTRLLAARSTRAAPAIDDKVVVAANGLAIDAFARAGAALAEPRYVNAAARAATFLVDHCRDESGRLAHQWRQGTATGLAFADDLACLAEGMASLYEATFDESWIAWACECAERLLGDDPADPLPFVPRAGRTWPGGGGGFVDRVGGGFFRTSADHEALLVREPDLLDSALPSATGMAATILLRLAAFTGRTRYRRAADGALAALGGVITRAPAAAAQALLALDVALGPGEEGVIVGTPDSAAAILAALRGRFRPHGLTALRPPDDGERAAAPLDGLFTGRFGREGTATLFLCHGGTCAAPLAGIDAVAAAGRPASFTD